MCRVGLFMLVFVCACLHVVFYFSPSPFSQLYINVRNVMSVVYQWSYFQKHFVFYVSLPGANHSLCLSNYPKRF